MRRAMLILLIIALLTAGGCGGGFLTSRRNMEHLRPIRTISLDRTAAGVVMGVSTGAGPDGGRPLVMKCEAPGIEAAIRRLQSFSPEDELFYAHVQYILLGESMSGESIMPLLDWVERSPSMRMDTAMLLVRGSASALLAGSAGESTDITERLASLEREEKARGRPLRSLREIAASLLERGGALCTAVSAAPTEDVVFSETGSSLAVIPEGFAVLRSEDAPVFLSWDETLGAALLTGSVNGAAVAIGDCVLELSGPGASVTGLWSENGELTGLSVRCTLRAGLLECGPAGPGDAEALGRALSAEAERWIEKAADRSRALGCDFAGLEAGAMKKAPLRARRGGFSQILPGLAVHVAVEAALDRSYDLTDDAAS